MADAMEGLRYPVGRFEWREALSPQELEQCIATIEELPARMRAAVAGLNDAQLDTPYRDEGWTVRQLVHHVADSHMNAFTRFRWALTEEQPTIKPYHEKLWAELADSRTAPIEESLQILDGLHARWTRLLGSLSAADLERSFRHPEMGKVFPLPAAIAMYAWHSRHHVAHITRLRERMQWAAQGAGAN